MRMSYWSSDVCSSDLHHRDDLIDNAGQFQGGFGAFDLRAEHLAVEVIELFVEDSDQPDVLVTDMLQLGEPPDQFAGMQAISTPRVGLAGFFGEDLRLPLGPLHTQTPTHSAQAPDNNN